MAACKAPHYQIFKENGTDCTPFSLWFYYSRKMGIFQDLLLLFFAVQYTAQSQRETFIPDACEALLEQERLGTLVIHRYHELTEGMLNWIRKVEADGIRNSNLLNTPGPMADYYREHYPESWAIVEREQEDVHE